jgi:hypothetical protein
MANKVQITLERGMVQELIEALKNGRVEGIADRERALCRLEQSRSILLGNRPNETHGCYWCLGKPSNAVKISEA